MLATLAARGFLIADPITRRYCLGPKLVALGRLAEQTAGVAALARPILAHLARVCRESAVLCQPEGAVYRCAAAVDGPGPLRYTTVVGELFPGYGGGAAGDAIFAHYPPDQVRTVLGETLTYRDGTPGESWDELYKQYAQIRASGIAISYGDYDPRVTAVAAPVLAHGVVIGSVAVLGPREDMRTVVDEITVAIQDAAARLARLYEDSAHQTVITTR